MCLRPRIVYTVCAHTDELPQENCTQEQIIRAAQQLGGFFLPRWMRSSCGPTWARPTCVTRADYRLKYDFCAACRSVFAVHGELTEASILNYWAYKNSQGMRQPVEPAIIPRGVFCGPLNAVRVDPRDLRLETITLSEALHIWDLPGEFFRSQAYRDGNSPLNLIEYLEEVRWTTLHRARRMDSARSPCASTSKPADRTDGACHTAELSTVREDGPSAARAAVPTNRPTKIPKRSSATARSTSYTLNSTAVRKEDAVDEAIANAAPRSPKGKEKSVGSRPQGEYQQSESANSAAQDHKAASQASMMLLPARAYSVNAAPSKFSAGSSKQVAVGSRKATMHFWGDSVPRRLTPVVPANSPVRSLIGAMETVSEVDTDGYQTDFTEYDSDKSPRRATAAKSLRQERNEVASHASSPLVAPTPVFHNRPWDSGKPDSEVRPANSPPYPITPAGVLFPSTTRSSGESSRFDRPDSAVLPDKWSPGPVGVSAAFVPSTFHPLPNLPSDIPQNEALPGGSNDSLPSVLAQHMADIDALFLHQFRPPSDPFSEADGASSTPALSSPSTSTDAGYFYNLHNPAGLFHPPTSPLTSRRIAAVAQQPFPHSPLAHTSFASPQPRAAARIGTPFLARTPSADLQALYRDAICTGRAVLHVPHPPPPVRTDEGDGAASRRKSAMGLVLSGRTTPRREREEEAAPRSAPPFPSRVARPFEEVSVTAVCLCREVGRAECLCPRVVQPVVWM